MMFRFAAFLFLGLFMALPAQAYSDKPVGLFLLELKEDAKKLGVSPELFDKIFFVPGGFKPIDRVVQLDRKQPEGTKTFTQYMTSVVPQSRVQEGRRRYAENKAKLDTIASQYGVPAQYIVSLWGIETSFGKNTGGFNVPHSLATLAYEGRRAEFFRGELLKALQIIAQGHISYEAMIGSWAGAMGQCQFMPSSFFNFAVDYNKDGHKDIWQTQDDVFASIANYLSKSGWNKSIPWGMKASVPAGFDTKLADINVFRNAAAWNQMGVKLAGGAPIPANAPTMALMYPGQPGEGAYLITSNYNVILKWNRSRYFATAVGTLADGIAGK